MYAHKPTMNGYLDKNARVIRMKYYISKRHCYRSCLVHRDNVMLTRDIRVDQQNHITPVSENNATRFLCVVFPAFGSFRSFIDRPSVFVRFQVPCQAQSTNVYRRLLVHYLSFWFLIVHFDFLDDCGKTSKRRLHSGP